MKKTYQVVVGGVELFAGAFAGAIAVIEASIEKPRYEVSKFSIENAVVGSKFRVTSRIKGSGSKATLNVIEVEEVAEVKAPKAKKSNAPEGLRSASWKYITEKLAGIVIDEVSVRKVTDKRYEVKVNGEVVWYSFKEELANSAKAAIESKLKVA